MPGQPGSGNRGGRGGAGAKPGGPLPPSAPPGSAATMPVARFAETATAAARSAPASAHYSGNKVFIAGLWDHVKGTAPFRGMTEATFKARLVEADRAGKLELGRGDLWSDSQHAAVMRSATPYLNAVYHFVRTD